MSSQHPRMRRSNTGAYPRLPRLERGCGDPWGREASLYDESPTVSLHRVDPRFVLPHPVRRAVVLDGLEGGDRAFGWRASRLKKGWMTTAALDLVVSTGRHAATAGRTNTRSVIVEASREGPLRRHDTAPGVSSCGRRASGRRWGCRSISPRPSRTRWSVGASSIAAGSGTHARGPRARLARAVPVLGLARRHGRDPS